MKITEALKSDYEKLYNLEQEWVKEGISPLMNNSSFEEFVKEMNSASVFIAKEDEKIIGYLVCKIRKSEDDNNAHNLKKGEEYADIDSLFVKKSKREKGVGKDLMNACLLKLKSSGYKKVIISADSKEMNKLVDYYKKLGFKVLFTRMMMEL